MKMIDLLKATDIPRDANGLLKAFESKMLSIRKSGNKTFVKYFNSVGNISLDVLAEYFKLSLGEVITIRDYVWELIYDGQTEAVNTLTTITTINTDKDKHKFDSELMQKWYNAHAKLRDANNIVLLITEEQDKPMDIKESTTKPTQEQRLARRIQKVREYGLQYGMGPKKLQKSIADNVEEFYKAEEEYAQKLQAEKAMLVFARDMAESCLKQENKKLSDLSVQLRELQAEIIQARNIRDSHLSEANRLNKELKDLQKQE